MAIAPIGGGIPLSSLLAPAKAAGADAPSSSAGAGFAAALGRGMEQLQATHDVADSLAVQAATGDLTDVHDYVIAATEASVATELTVAVRNKAVEAFNEIMRMPV